MIFIDSTKVETDDDQENNVVQAKNNLRVDGVKNFEQERHLETYLK
jgi:hypothetical protein